MCTLQQLSLREHLNTCITIQMQPQGPVAPDSNSNVAGRVLEGTELRVGSSSQTFVSEAAQCQGKTEEDRVGREGTGC